MNNYRDINNGEKGIRVFSKSTLLLALGIFLVIAPPPDNSLLADLTRNFIVSLPW